MYYNIISSMSSGVITPSYTSRTTAFASATAITDTTILNALNTFDLGLISNGLDTKMKALYPMVGGTATTHKYNFMDSRDLDVAFRLQFNGGWVHSSTGALPNGINAYADTFLVPFDVLINNNYHLSHYSRTQNIITSAIEIGSVVTEASSLLALDQYYAGVSAKAFVAGGYPNYTVLSNLTNTLGFKIGSRISNISSKLYFNGSYIAQNTTLNLSTLPSQGNSLYISANHNYNLSKAQEFSNKETPFASIGNGLTDGEATTFYNLVQAMQTSLSRQV